MSTSIEALKAYAVIGADLSELKRGVKDADAELSRLGANARADGLDSFIGDVSSKLRGVGSKLTDIGTGLTASITAPLTAIAASVLAVGASFDDAFDKMRIGTGATGEELEKLQQSFRNIASSSPSSLNDVSTALTELSRRTSATGADLEALAKTELDLARITGSDLKTQIQQTTRLFGDWGISVENQTPALDSLLKISQKTGIGITDLSAKLVQFGAPLRQMGFSFEQAAGILGKFEKEGVNSELVMGSLRIALTKMAKEGINDPAQALDVLTQKIKDAGSAGKANAIAMAVFGARAGPDMAAAIREGRFEVGALLDSIKQSPETIAGAAASTADFAESFSVLKNKVLFALEPLGAKLFQAVNNLMPLFEKAVGVIEQLVTWFGNLSPTAQTVGVALGAIAAAAGPVLVIVGQIASAIGSVVGLFGSFGAGAAAAGEAAAGAAAGAGVFATVLEVLTGPVGIAIAAITALVAAYTTNFAGIGDAIDGVISDLQPFIDKFVEGLKQAWEGAKLVFEAIKPYLSGLLSFIGNTLSGLIDVIRAILKALSGDWSGAWEMLKSAAAKIWTGIVDLIQGQVEALNNLLALAWQLMVSVAIGAWNGLTSILSGIWNGIKAAAIAIWNGLVQFFVTTIPNALLALVNFFASLPAKILEFISQIPEDVARVFGLLVGTGVGLISEFVADVIDFFSQLPQRLVSIATQVWELVKNAFTSGTSSIAQVVSSGFEAVVNFFASLPERLVSLAVSIWERVTAAFNAGVQLSIQAAVSLYNGINEWTGKLPELFTNIWTSIVDYITGIPALLWEKAKSIGAAIWNGFKEGLDIHSPSGPEQDTERMGAGIVRLLSKAGVSVSGPAQGVGKSIRAGFASGFTGLDKEIDSVIALMVSSPEKIEKAVVPGFKKAAQGVRAGFKELLDTVNEFQDALGTGVKLTERQLVELVNTFGRALPDAALQFKRTREDLQKEVVRLNEVFRASNQDLKAVFKDGRVLIQQGGKEFTDELEKNRQAVARVASLNAIFNKTNAELVVTLEERNKIVVRSTADLIPQTSAVAEKISENIRQKLGEDLANKLAIEGEKLRDVYVGNWKKIAEESRLTTSQSVELMLKELAKLPPQIQEVVRPGVDAYIEELNRAGAFTKELADQMGGTFSDFFNKLKDTLGNGMAELVARVLQSLGKLNIETIKRFGEVSSGILDVVGALPGKVGDKLRAVTQTFLDWVNRVDTILKGLHKIFQSIPDGLGELAAKILGAFKSSNKQVLDTTTATQDSIQKAAKAASEETEGLASSVEGSTSKIGKAFAVAASAVGAFVSGLATANATGSKFLGSLTGGLQGALSGFATGGPIGALIGGIGGILGGLFGGKSAAQKQQEKLQLDRLKQDVQKGAQEVMQAAFDTMQKALETFEKLADFSQTPRRLIALFFAQMRIVIEQFIAFSKIWSVQMLDATKKFAESVGPILETIGIAVDAFAKLSGYAGVAKSRIDRFNVDLKLAMDGIIAWADTIEKSALKHARKFAEKAQDVVALIGTGVDAFNAVATLRGFHEASLARLVQAIESAVDAIAVVADLTDNFLLKQAQRWSLRVTDVLDAIKSGVDAFTGLASFKSVLPSTLDAFATSVKLAVDKMAEIAGVMDAELVQEAQLFSDKARAVIDLVSAGAQAFIELATTGELAPEKMEVLGNNIRRAVEIMVAISSSMDVDMAAAAAVFAASAQSIVDLIKNAVDAFNSLNTLQEVSVGPFDALELYVRRSVESMGRLGTEISDRLVSAAAIFADKIKGVFDLISTAVGAFKALAELSIALDIEASINFLVENIRSAVEAIGNMADLVGQDMFDKAVAYASQVSAVLNVISQAAQTFKEFTNIGFVTTQNVEDFYKDFVSVSELFVKLVDRALEIRDMALVFRDAMKETANAIAEGVAGMKTSLGALKGVVDAGGTASALNILAQAARAVAVGATATVMAASMGGASGTFAPASSTTQTHIAYGDTTTHIEEGPIYVQVDMSKIREVEDLVAIIDEARQRRRARRVS